MRLMLIVAAVALVAAFVVLTPDALYDWVKAGHVIAIIAWMAAMLYLPRLFVYHSEAAAGTPQSETFKIMERRLLKAIMTPAMIAAWVLGLWLAWRGFGFSGGWLHAKIAAVFKATDRSDKPTRHWRIMNEVPTLLMVVIVVLVIVKPF
jgi:protoporphyrinogen IX oxidase